MNKRKFFLLPICLLLLGACNLNQPESKESKKVSEPEVSEPETSSVEEQTSSECEHEFGEWTVSMIATCTEKGEETRVCSKCGASEKRETNELGHKWDDGVVTTIPTVEAKGAKLFTCERCNATKTEEIDKATGIRVTFVHSAEDHFKVLVYKTQNYATETPEETYSCYARDENGNAIDFDANADLQPQVSFKVVVDNGYSINATNIKITGTYKNLKQNPNKGDADKPYDDDSLFRITKVQEDLTITITPVAGEQAPGRVVTFVPTHCSVKVYIGPKNADGTNVDTGSVYYSRAKAAPYDPSVASDAQFFFEVVCENGYEFNPTITNNKVDFIVGEYNKISLETGGYYKLTKVTSDLTITVTATPISA